MWLIYVARNPIADLKIVSVVASRRPVAWVRGHSASIFKDINWKLLESRPYFRITGNAYTLCDWGVDENG